jgi:hypothetical protein
MELEEKLTRNYRAVPVARPPILARRVMGAYPLDMTQDQTEQLAAAIIRAAREPDTLRHPKALRNFGIRRSMPETLIIIDAMLYGSSDEIRPTNNTRLVILTQFRKERCLCTRRRRAGASPKGTQNGCLEHARDFGGAFGIP